MENSEDNFFTSEHHALLQTFRESLMNAGKSDHTVKAYTYDLQTFIRWFQLAAGTGVVVLHADSRDIVEYRGFLVRDGKKVATVNRRLKSLQFFYKWAVRQGKIPA